MKKQRWGRRWLTVGALALFTGSGGRAFGVDAGRKVLVRQQPRYPELAKQMRVWGDIRLLVVVLPSGEVQDVTVVSGHPMLQNAACEAVKQWRFAAGPEKTQVDVLVTFSLPGDH